MIGRPLATESHSTVKERLCSDVCWATWTISATSASCTGAQYLSRWRSVRFGSVSRSRKTFTAPKSDKYRRSLIVMHLLIKLLVNWGLVQLSTDQTGLIECLISCRTPLRLLYASFISPSRFTSTKSLKRGARVWTQAPGNTRENVSVSFWGRKAVMIEINSKGRHSREVQGMLCYVIVGCTVQYRLIRQSHITGPRHEIWCLSQVT